MKSLVFAVILLSFTLLGAVDLINESFTATSPATWFWNGFNTSHWAWSNTANSGGTAGELRFSDSPYDTGITRYISPMFDTRKVHNMTLTFRTMLDDYVGSSNLYTIGAQITTDGTNWTNIWSTTTSTTIPASYVSANISFELGKSQTTQIAFFFNGYTFDLNNWYIDNVILSYTNTLGSGMWDVGSHYPIGDVIVPNGHTLTLQAGTTLYMGNDTIMDVDGRLLANGTVYDPIYIGCAPLTTWKGIKLEFVGAANDSTLIQYTNISNSTQSGINIQSSHKVRINHCSFMNNSVSSAWVGGGLHCNQSDIILEYSEFFYNIAALRGAAAEFSNCNPTVRHNSMFENTISNLGILSFINCNLSNVQYNYISNNRTIASGEAAVYIYSCFGFFSHNVINNNDSIGIYFYDINTYLLMYNCDVVNNASIGIYLYEANSLHIDNSIVWGNGFLQIDNTTINPYIPIRFCCIQNGFSGVSGIAESSIEDCIAADPLFVNPTTGVGADYYSTLDGYRLQDLSPCIDAGSYYYSMDEDFSRADIGAFPRRLKPTFYMAADVSPDQGHQIDLRWYRNDKDYSWDPSAWYHVFRRIYNRNEIPTGAMIVNNPGQITPELVAQNREIYWQDGTRTMYFLGQQKAMNRTDYGLIVPTLQDSSSTGTHDEDFVVTYFDNVYFWDSVGMTGHSVDNIPPYAPSRVEITRLDGNSFNLDWDEVTEGGWEGNSYPEINPVTYKVYAGSTPDFILDSGSYIGSTTNLNLLLNNQTEPKRFYKVIATDSQ